MATPRANKVDFIGICFAYIRDGRIAEAWNNFDFLSLYPTTRHATELKETTMHWTDRRQRFRAVLAGDRMYPSRLGIDLISR